MLEVIVPYATTTEPKLAQTISPMRWEKVWCLIQKLLIRKVIDALNSNF